MQPDQVSAETTGATKILNNFMVKWATQKDVDDGKKIVDELRKRYLPILNLIGEDLLCVYKQFELPYIVRRIKERNVKTVLDFGTGTSCLPAYLDSLGYEVWCLDDGSWHPEVNEKNYNETYQSKVVYIVADLLKKPNCIPDDYFDVIYSASVLEHIPNPQEYLKILDKKLKKGGLHFHIIDAKIPEDIYQPKEGMGRLVITR
jgi:ubiquinone/menaquinone biosynthesis C-methylase UbiE